MVDFIKNNDQLGINKNYYKGDYLTFKNMIEYINIVIDNIKIDIEDCEKDIISIEKEFRTNTDGSLNKQIELLSNVMETLDMISFMTDKKRDQQIMEIRDVLENYINTHYTE